MGNVVKFSVVAVILALGMILSSALLSKFFVRIRHEQSIRVKGYAEKDIVSDIGKFSCTFSARGPSLKESYDALQKSKEVVLAYLKRAGFADADLTLDTIDTWKVRKRNAVGNDTNEIEYYDVSQRITVTSENVGLLNEVSIEIAELIKEGIDISASRPEFLVSDLKDIKIQLLAEATDDAHQRAVTMAERSGGEVGALISATQGVFQITERNSTDISGYGEYNTGTIEKTAKAVVTLEYAIERKR